MDFNLKQWRDESEEDEHETSSAKLARLDSSSPALPLFVPQPHYSPHHSTATKHPRIGMSYFSWAQWQELELQALIFRHIMSSGGVPPELLHLVKKSLVSSPLHYYHPCSLVQTGGYWGKGGMDPEPGRCRRTDGKKWRCSRDVVPAQKYCERHMHRGKNRSRKPVEIPIPIPIPSSTTTTAPRFTLSGSIRHNQPIPDTKFPFQAHNDGGDPTLRHFFDDWPRSLDDDAARSAPTSLSISTSDFSLKLGSSSSGNGNESRGEGSSRPQMNWGMAGGPLAEALRSSLSTSSSPTSVLHRLQPTSASHTSFVTP